MLLRVVPKATEEEGAVQGGDRAREEPVQALEVMDI